MATLQWINEFRTDQNKLLKSYAIAPAYSVPYRLARNPGLKASSMTVAHDAMQKVMEVYAIHKGRTLMVSETSYSWFDHNRRLPERGFLRDGTPYRNLAVILARLKISQRNTEAQRHRS